MTQQHRQGIILLLVAAALWSLGGILIKSTQLHPLAIAGSRSAIAGLVLAVAARRFSFIWTKTQWLSAFFFAMTVISFVTATKLTTAANAILLQYTAPLYVALLSGPLLGEKISRQDLKSLCVVMVGMVIFFLEKIELTQMLGNFVALISGIAYAGMTLCLRLQNGKSTFESLFLGHIITALVGLPFLLMGPLPTSSDLGFLLVLGIFQLGIPYVLFGWAIRHVTALEASLLPVVEPILNPIWVLIFANEVPSKYSLVGGAVVIAGTLWHVTLKAKSIRRRAQDA